MNKRFFIIMTVVAVALFGSVALSLVVNIQDSQNQGYDMVDNIKRNDRLSKSEAIEQAEAWSPPPDQTCTMALTDAVHKETGAEYTFPSGCLAPGWEPAN